MDIVEFLNQYSNDTYKVQGTKYNQYSTNPVNLGFNEVDINIFNIIYKYLKSSDLNALIRTKSGAIKKCFNNRYSWDEVHTKSSARLTIIVDGKVWVFRVGTIKEKEDQMPPWKAWNMFEDCCEKNGINLNDYKINNGLEVKKEIPNPLICMKYHMKETDEPIYNVHHIDFHNSYPSGLVNKHPEFRKVVEPMYKLRKVKPEFKFVLNCVVGCMQSTKHRWNAQWAHLAKDAIMDNNYRVTFLAKLIELSGGEILGFNTDGIWYKRDTPYHGAGEGPNLGQWQNDHVNCAFRSKSDGAYEFAENGRYYPVVRGETTLDRVRDRDKWDWGDIYKGDLITFKFDEKEGIIYEEKQS